MHAPPGFGFVLGDTPLPQSDLAAGFRVPISASTAVSGTMHTSGPWISRRPALSAEIAEINREQWENAAEIALGPDASVLNTL
jgi:hypothetical protein